MKVYSLEIEYEYEEDFGSFNTQLKLIGVYATKDDAMFDWKFTYKNISNVVDYDIKEWDV